MYCTVLYCTVLYSTVLYITTLYFNVLYFAVRDIIPVERTIFLHIFGMLEKETKLEFLATSSDGSTVFRMNTASAVANLIKPVILKKRKLSDIREEEVF